MAFSVMNKMLLRHKLALAFASRLPQGTPFVDGLDLAGTVFTVGAVDAGLGFADLAFSCCLLYTASNAYNPAHDDDWKTAWHRSFALNVKAKGQCPMSNLDPSAF